MGEGPLSRRDALAGTSRASGLKFQNSLPGALGTSGVRQVRKCGQMLDGLSEMPLVRIRGHGPLISSELDPT